MQTARGVDDDRVESLSPGFGERAGRSRHRIHGLGRVDFDFGLLTDDRQLLNGGGTAYVGRYHQRMLALLTQPASELAAGRGLTRTLEPEQEDDTRYGRVFLQSTCNFAKEREQFVANDLDDLLDRGQALEDGLIGRLVAYPVDESLDDLEVDVGFEQREPNLAQRRFDVLLGQAHLAPQGREGALDTGA